MSDHPRDSRGDQLASTEQPANPGGEGRRYIRICRNPHEPFYWDAETPDEPCPGEGCEDGPHETWVRLSEASRLREEAERARAADELAEIASTLKLAGDHVVAIADTERCPGENCGVACDEPHMPYCWVKKVEAALDALARYHQGDTE